MALESSYPHPCARTLTLRGTTPATVVLTYTKGVLSYKVVPINRDLRPFGAIIEGSTFIFCGCSGEVHCWPLLLVTFRNSEGVMLVCFLNAVLNADFELKPTSSDTARME